MPLELSSVAIDEKNNLATDSVFLVLLEVTIPGEADPVRVVRNTEDITWAGHLWQAFPFEIDEVSQGDRGEIPQINIRISNVSRDLERYVQDYDLYCKQNGYRRIDVTIYVVNSKNLADPDPEVSHEFILKNPKPSPQWMTFVLSANNPFTRRAPQARILRSHCRYNSFKERRCQYVGAETSCDKTLVRCRALGNSVNFGGFPGSGTGGLNV